MTISSQQNIVSHMTLHNSEELVKASSMLSHKDPVLAKIIKQVTLSPSTPHESYFIDLVESIISQQLSIKAADTIWKRVQALLPDQRVTPEGILALPDDTIRAAGISYSKIKYIKDLADKTLASGILFEQFETMTDEEIITELTKVKGIGRWTAEMFLIFAMGRPDVFSYGDLGIRKGIKNLYGFKKEPTFEEAEKIAEKWRPYRSVACRYLWKSLEL